MSNGMSCAYFSSLPRLFIPFPSHAASEPHLMATSLFYNIHWSVTCFLYLSSSLTMSIFSLGMFGITGIYSFTGNGSSLRVLYASLGLGGLLHGIGISR